MMANAVSAMASASMVGLIVFTPIFMQLVYHVRTAGSGLMLIALSGAATLGSFGGGRLVAATGRYKLITIAGLAGNVAGMLLMSSTTGTTPLAIATTYIMLSGLGLGTVMPVMLVAVQNVLEADDHGAGTASTNFFRSIGGSFGAAIFGSVLTGQLAVHIDAVPGHEALGADPGFAFLNAGGGALDAVPADLREAVLLSMPPAFDDMFRVGAAVSSIALVVALFLREARLRKAAGKTSAASAASKSDM